ncbi:hypothetical protein P170DRAFT_434810 [Aspergillus steynii IBT 23096]|uniref:Uncharacterized protein n=1 Tax=Aspergillus steynii IBT 23096 TaxID=1392250 RepID=A0A2I2GJN6_9EURO|nr:uncharacterized protein P170DRAFT_434810 [Aspergillus steynii IBT 23096]PLB53091.1 hypothetical protein P170DRAFT_434810 [Aspergillus steynii IBT 23096]
MPTSAPMTFSSQRQRTPSEDSDIYSASSPSNVSIHSLPEARLREEEDLGRYSPRAAVAGRLGELAIRADPLSTPQFTNGRFDQAPMAQPLHTSWTSPDYHGMAASNPAPASQDWTSGPSAATVERDRDLHHDGHTLNANPAVPDISPKKSASASPRKKRNPLAAARPRSQRRSPPPPHTPPENPLTWHDSEITGHDPTDPSDDGYGINGLGFKPTASMAWNRSQKRQKQITDWRSRESREARERRREKREGVELDKIRTIQKGAIQKKVKFDV